MGRIKTNIDTLTIKTNKTRAQTFFSHKITISGIWFPMMKTHVDSKETPDFKKSHKKPQTRPTHFPSSWDLGLNISCRCHPEEVWNMLPLLLSFQLTTQTGSSTGHAEGQAIYYIKILHLDCHFLAKERSEKVCQIRGSYKGSHNLLWINDVIYVSYKVR